MKYWWDHPCRDEGRNVLNVPAVQGAVHGAVQSAVQGAVQGCPDCGGEV